MEAGGVGAPGAVLQSPVPKADLPDLTVPLDPRPHPAPEVQGVGGGAAGGVEGQDLGLSPPEGGEAQHPVRQVRDGPAVGRFQIAVPVPGLDGEVLKAPRGLRQGPARKGAARQVGG